MAASLQRHNYQQEKGLEATKKFTAALQRQTGISDELSGTSIQTLLDYNNDLQTSFYLTKVAADLAAGGHMDMKAAVDLVGKASVGYTGTLSRYGIIIDESIPKSEKFNEAIKQINQRFGGAAAARIETYAGQIDLLAQNIADLEENIGAKVTPALIDATSRLNDMFAVMDAQEGVVASWGAAFAGLWATMGMTDAAADAYAIVQKGIADCETAIKEMEAAEDAAAASLEWFEEVKSNRSLIIPVAIELEDEEEFNKELEEWVQAGWDSVDTMNQLNTGTY